LYYLFLFLTKAHHGPTLVLFPEPAGLEQDRFDNQAVLFTAILEVDELLGRAGILFYFLN
jgi:hypothetical protein